MNIFFLVIIYMTFISLGLPDSLLGSAWPKMHLDLGVPLASAGLISMIYTGGTIVSSLFSSKMINRWGTGKITFVSVAATALALAGFAVSPSYVLLCLLAVPLGLGAGAIDAGLNNFIALHYKARHMSWLHCFWGVGATSGPVIMSLFITQSRGWAKGYLTISIIQFFVVFLLFITLPMWRKYDTKSGGGKTPEENKAESNLLKLPGIKAVLVSFFCYCAVEATAGLWGSSYLVSYKGISPEIAARWIALFYGAITIGRLISGFLTLRVKSVTLIRIGEITCIAGAAALLLPFPAYFSMLGLILLGLGCAPIFPSMLHETPNNFGEKISQSVMGLQMAFAYIGCTVMPPLLGLIAAKTGIMVFPFFLLVLILVMFICSEKINTFIKAKFAVT